MTYTKSKSRLKLIACDRSSLMQRLRYAVWLGTNDELEAVVNKLVRRGRLASVISELSSAPDIEQQVGHANFQSDGNAVERG